MTASRRPFSNPFRALWRIMALFVCTLAIFVVLVTRRALAGGPEGRRRVSFQLNHFWGKCCARIMGYRIHTQGPLPPPGALLTPNHLGYADIFALSAALPCFFAPKGDIATWPFIGMVIRASEHIFISRKRARDLTQSTQEIEKRLHDEQHVCVFLEGTSSNGIDVLPFRPSFLQAALNTGKPIVPVALVWSSPRPGVDLTEDIAYWRDHVFVPHLFRHLGLGNYAVEILFAPAIDPQGWERKALAEEVRRRIVELRRPYFPEQKKEPVCKN